MLVSLEMDEKHMIISSLGGLSQPMPYLGIGAHLFAGVFLGIFFFRCLWWQTQMLAGDAVAWGIVAMILGRYALLGSALVLASMTGAGMLISLTIGVLAGRQLALRKIGKTAP